MSMSESPGMGLPARRYRWVLVALAIMAFFLFVPKTPGSACIQIIRFAQAVEVPLNCDSRLLAKLYRNAETYFTDFNNWKGRPVFFVYGVFAAPVMEAVAVPLWTAVGGTAVSDRKVSHYRTYFSLHLAYYALNVAVVLLTIWMAFNLVGLAASSGLALALAASIASTDLVHGSVWLAHTNIYNLLAAIACAFFVRLGWQTRETEPGTVLAWMAGAGLMLLVYPLFVILLPAFLSGVVLRGLFGRQTGAPFLLSVPVAGLAVLLFVLPLLGWNLAVRTLFATDVYLTAQYGQFVWLVDAYRAGTLASAMADNALTFFNTLGLHLNLFETVPVLVACAALVLFGDRSRLRASDPVLIAIAIALIGVLAFNYLQGYYAARLQVSVVALLFLLLARIALLTGGVRLGGLVLVGVTVVQLIDAATSYSLSAA
ncbi:MAG: hypothetical protein AAGL24_19550 [Pseudomonadota bacterium]